MTDLYLSPLIFLVGLITTIIGIGILVPWLTSWDVLDLPNKRSSHTNATIKGAGLVLVPVLAIMFLFIDYGLKLPGANKDMIMTHYIVAGLIILAAVSWIDDLYGLTITIRLAVQLIVITIVLLSSYEQIYFFPSIVPVWAWFLFLLLSWAWFTNLFNFMDGVDGISAVQSFSICLGVIGIAIINGWEASGQWHSIAIAGVSLGFLWWNWHPARIFLGDVGSIPLGFLLAWLLYGLVVDGFYIQVIILPLYYIVDATLTITIRLFKSQNIWESHRDHFYQKAVQGGLSHDRVSLTIAFLNIFLIVFAVLALWFPVTSLSASIISTIFTIIYFGTRKNVRV